MKYRSLRRGVKQNHYFFTFPPFSNENLALILSLNMRRTVSHEIKEKQRILIKRWASDARR